jgi:formylglycine-generating enzyme required for sulfatase activity
MNHPGVQTGTRRRWLRSGLLASSLIMGASCYQSKAIRVTHTDLIRDQAASLWRIEFDMTWSNSFRDSTNWDAAWVFVKFRRPDGEWEHATLSSDTSDYSVAGSAGLPVAFAPVRDGRGVFVQRANDGRGTVEWRGIRLAWDRTADDVSAQAKPTVRVFALPMVYVPAGAFRLGDGEIGNIWGHFQGAEPGEPFAVLSEDSITLGGDGQGRLGNNDRYGMSGPTDLWYPNSAVADDFGSNQAVALPASFPKGFRAFYAMRYELTQRQYADFLNTLTDEQLKNRNPARGRARPGVYRYTITTIRPFVASVPDRPVNWVSWGDAAAYADWAGLRPMTEFEFEKAARGPREPEPGEFAWGNATIYTGRYTLTDEGARGEQVGNPSPVEGNAAYSGSMGGDPRRSCGSCLLGPLPVHAFMAQGATRTTSGASWYGLTELSGNLYEWTVTVGNSAGRRFDGSHGDGQLDPVGHASGPEVANWPGAVGNQVTGARGAGLRGGSWATPADFLRISNRRLAATSDTLRNPTLGIRLVRTAPALSHAPTTETPPLTANPIAR